jgi:hypothetical protein
MVAPDAAYWARMSKLVAMLSSPFDGEALAARAKIDAALKDAQLSWSDLAQRFGAAAGGGSSSSSSSSYDRQRREEEERRRAEETRRWNEEAKRRADEVRRQREAEEALRQAKEAAEGAGYPHWRGNIWVAFGTCQHRTSKAALIKFLHLPTAEWFPLSQISRPADPMYGYRGEWWLSEWIIRQRGIE